MLSNNAREMVSGELTGLPDAPVVSEIASELLMSELACKLKIFLWKFNFRFKKRHS